MMLDLSLTGVRGADGRWHMLNPELLVRSSSGPVHHHVFRWADLVVAKQGGPPAVCRLCQGADPDPLRAQGTDAVPRTRSGATDWPPFLAGVWLYLTVAVLAGLAAVLALLGLGRIRR